MCRKASWLHSYGQRNKVRTFISKHPIQSSSINSMMVVFHDMPFEYRVRTMRLTTVFFSIHGAQLSNIIFLRPNSTLIGVFNPHLRVNCYRGIARMARIQYESITDIVMEASTLPTVFSVWQPYLNVHVYVNVTDAMRIIKKHVT